MIVDPDFPDHWKTRMLVDSLDGDEAAPVYLLRLWGHCQLRRAWEFSPLPAAGLKALCHYPGDAETLDRALVAAGFSKRSGETLTVCGWEEYNAALIANWKNGRKGGRPRKNPWDTHGIPMENPWKTHGEPIGEDRKRDDIDSPLIPLPGETHEQARILPKGWQKMTREERKRRRVESNSPAMVTIGGFFGRKPGTLWTVAEAVALLDVKPTPEEVEILARYYAEEFSREEDYRRRDLQTLLNNWPTEIDRARSHYATPSR